MGYRLVALSALLLAGASATPALAQTGYGVHPAPKPTGYGAATEGKTGGYGTSSVTVDTPPNAKPGQCFARINVPPNLDTVSEQVLVEAEHKISRIVPAVYGWEDKQVTIKEACSEFITIPATYKTVTETVVVKAATVRKVIIPAVYETVTERVLVSPATTRWQRGVGLTQAGYGTIANRTRVTPSGDIMCLVDVPAEYRTVSKKVVKTAEVVREIDIPAITKETSHQVVDTPARVVERKIPAVTKTEKAHIVVEPERVEEVVVPAIYKTVTKTVVVSLGKLEWQEILCHTNTSRDVLYRVQVALSKRGYFKGRATGVFGRDSMDALIHFQKDQRLASGELTMETVKVLDVGV